MLFGEQLFEMEIASFMKACRLCARDCGINRMTGAGRCGETMDVLIARAALHMWEEPCISGTRGSGAVFFEGCPLGCVFCQNREIAHVRRGRGAVGAGLAASGGASGTAVSRRGKAVSADQFARICLRLQSEGANNINLVTPTHYIPQIIDGIGRAREEGLAIPVVYNTASIEKPESIRLLDGTVDIYLPDLKYMDSGLSERYSHMPGYFTAAGKAIDEMVRQAGDPVFEETDQGPMMKRGTIVRHMVMPGHTEDSKRVLDYLFRTYGNGIYISIMSQYTPMPGIKDRFPELFRRVTKREYEKVVDYALSIGIENAFIQEGGVAKESFIPAFDGEGVPETGN